MPEIFHNNHIPESVKRFVITRLDVDFPSGKGLSIGRLGSFSKQELIEHVEQGDDVGRMMVKMEYEYLEALKSGKLLREIAALPE